MNITTYNPVSRLFSALQNELDDLIVDDPSLIRKNSIWSPRVDIQTKEDKYIVLADLPGIDPKDINVKMDGNLLIIDGEKREEKTSKNDDYSRVERFVGRFYRQFTLPENVNANQIEATSKNGVLQLVIPKAEKKEVKKIDVKHS